MGSVSEDIAFCRKAREAGFDIYLDGTQTIGHLTGVSVRPHVDGIVFDLDREQNIMIPKEQIEVVIEEPV